jgi:hypothetical protein
MWMLPFVTKRDLEQAAQTAHVSLETRNLFLNKMLSEHSQTGIRNQLHSLWTEWVAKTCDEQLVPEVSESLGMEAATPPDDEPSEEETDEVRPGLRDGDILLAGGSAADDAAAVQAAEQRLAGASAGGD